MIAMDASHQEFEQRYRAWKAYIQDDEIALSSSDQAYIHNPPYRAIVEMGWEAVPLIIEKLKTDEEAHFLIHALREITQERRVDADLEANQAPSNKPRGNQAYAEKWIAWWDERRASTDDS